MDTKGDLDNYKELREEDSKIKDKKRDLRRKIFRIFFKVIRWPFLFVGIPIIAFLIPYFVSGLKDINEAINNDATFFAMVVGLVLGSILSGIIGSLINKTFLATTGLAALIYIVFSFFIKNKSAGVAENPYIGNISFENTKLIVIVLLTLFIFIGDLIVLIIRLLKNRKERKEA